MEIIIHQAILHVLDTTMDAPVLSGGGMEMTAEKTAYFQYHIEKLLASDDIRQCRPLPDSAFKNELEHNKDFVDLSCRIAGVLFDYMHAHTTIPGADLAVVDFTRDGEPWLGILKLNYKNGYTHYTENVEGAPVNSIIQQRACLPSQSGKVEEGALVNLTDYSMKLLEKKFDIDGRKEFYLSTVVFQYTTAQPEKKKLQAIQEAAVQAVQENYADQPHVEAQVAMLIANQAADNDNQVSVQQVRQQLEEEYPLAAVPFDDYVEKSDVLEAPEQPVTVTPARIRRMESRSIHTANGIEVKIPTELLSSDNEVEFLHSDDGSIGRSCRAPPLPGQARFQGSPPARLSTLGACDPAGSTAGGGGRGACGPVCRAGTGTSRRTAYSAGAGPPRGGPHYRCGALLVHRRAGPHQQRSVRRGRRRGLFRRQAQHRH